jgi:hypothetical protein
MFVCAEGGGGREVVANRPFRRQWETFTIERQPGGEIHAGDYVALRASNGQYVCAEGGGGREVVANRDVAAGWETFRLGVIDFPDAGLSSPNVRLALDLRRGTFDTSAHWIGCRPVL